MEVHVELAAETLFEIGPIPVTNSMVTMLIVMGVILLVGWAIARRAQVVPGRAQGGFEMIVEFLLNLVEATAGRRLGRRIFPLVASLFIFIIVANYSGLFPGVGTIGIWEAEEPGEEAEELEVPEADVEGHQPAGIEVAALPGDARPEANLRAQEGGDEAEPAGEGSVEDHQAEDPSAEGAAAGEEQGEEAAEHEEVLVPLFRAPNADLNMTLAMALVTFTTVQVLGVRAHGLGGRIRHMADPPFMFPIELISELSRIISLSARLFGNVFAGEVLLGVMVALANAVKIALIPVVFPVVFLFLEMLFGFIQALVFALLTLIYITLAAAEHGHGHGPDEEHEAAQKGYGTEHAHAATPAGD